MNFREKIDADLKAAMKERNEDRKRVLRLILAAIKLAEVEKSATLDDTGIANIIQKEIKIRREALEGAEAAHREDIIAMTNQEIAILEEFLPPQLTEEELIDIATQTANELGATSPADTGRLMKVLMPRVQGRTTGDRVSQVVRQVLQNRS
jgi:uncharacterized protein YqeY